MAERLIESWRLAVLRVRLDVTSEPVMVSCDVEAFIDGERNKLEGIRLPPEDFGLPRSGDPTPGARLLLPERLQDVLAHSLTVKLAGESALWLRLVPPYGLLGAVPWEDIVDRTQVPLLRIPDRLPVPVDPGRAWRVAIAIDRARTSGWPTGAAAGYLRNYSAEIQRAGVPVEIHVFADEVTSRDLYGQLPQGLFAVHDARSAPASRGHMGHSEQHANRRRSGPPPSAWGAWIREGTGDRSIRALHVISDAMLVGREAFLAVSPEPAQPAGPDSCRYVTGEDVAALADALGATTLSFGSPPGNRSDLATRTIADAIGQQRAGSTFYIDGAADPHASALAATHLFAADDHSPLPTHPALFGYVQPERARAALRDPLPRELVPQEWDAAAGTTGAFEATTARTPDVAPCDDLERVYANEDTVARWVAASERFLAQTASRFTASDLPQIPADNPYRQGVLEAVQLLRGILDATVSEGTDTHGRGPTGGVS